MELRGALRVRDPAWNPEKMGFFLEARGNMQHQFMEKGQATVQNALRVAEKSAFDLFLSQLQQDQSFFRAHLFYISLHDAQCVCVCVAYGARETFVAATKGTAENIR